jgi:hypothetical protein
LGASKPAEANIPEQEEAMAELEQKRFAAVLRLLRTAYPRDWELHLRNMGVPASADLPPADLDRIMERVFWMVRQTGLKNPAAWMAFDMARMASVEPEGPPKVALPVPVRQGPVEFEPVKLRTDLAKTSGPSPLGSATGSKVPGARIGTDKIRVEAASASVERQAALKVAPTVAVRQNPVELKPARLGTDLAKTSGASPPASETGSKIPAARIAIDMAGVEAASASVEPEAPLKVPPPAVRQNAVELEPVKPGVDLAKTSNASQLELETAIVIAQQLTWAKLSIAAGKPREAADFMYDAHVLYGASQQKIAAAVGKSQGWVSCMIRWRRERFKDDTPFGPASKEARWRARFMRVTGQRVPRLWPRCR